MNASNNIRLVNKHSSGLYGEVWTGEQLSLRRKVAVKVIKVDMAHLATAKDHALALAGLNHPCIVTVHSLEKVRLPEGGEVDAIVMEWLEGMTLADRLKQGDIPTSDVFSIVESLIQGLRHMHSRGVFHGDLHPGNILIGPSFIKIIDVSAADPLSVARYSTMSKESMTIADIGYAVNAFRMCLNRCNIDLSSLQDELNKLSRVQSLDEVESVLQSFKDFANPTAQPQLGNGSLDVLDDHSFTLTDRLLLRMCGDVVLNGRHVAEVITAPNLVEEGMRQGHTSDQMHDSFEILGNLNVFRSGQGRFARFVQLSSFGFGLYLTAYYPKYNQLLRSVKVAIVRDSIMADQDIALHINQPLPLVQHCINVIEQEHDCKVSRTNNGFKIVNVSASLRRDVR